MNDENNEKPQRDAKGRFLPGHKKPKTIKKKIIVRPSEHNLPVPRGFIVKNDEYVQVNATGNRLKKKPAKRRIGYRRKRNRKPTPPPEFFYSLRKVSIRFQTISIHEDDKIRLEQLVKFYRMKSKPRMLSKLINETFEKAYKESLYLKAIHERRQSEQEAIWLSNSRRELEKLQAAKLSGDPSGDLLPYIAPDGD